MVVVRLQGPYLFGDFVAPRVILPRGNALTTFAGTSLKKITASYSLKKDERTHHSLSYHDTSFTKSSVSAIPAVASKMEERASPIKSEDTTASSVYPWETKIHTHTYMHGWRLIE